MTRIERSIEIDAPPEAVFNELTDLHHLTRWSTITVSHDGGDEPLALGQEFEQKIRVAGIRLPSSWRCTEHDPPRIVAYEATSPGGGRLHMRQVVTETGSGSTVAFTIDYDLPGGILGDLLDRTFVERRNGREAEHSLENLKELVEHRR